MALATSALSTAFEALGLWRLFIASTTAFLIYVITSALFNLYLSPLSQFSGPRAAAVTKLYEAYHYIVKNDWLANLERLHVQYGPVVRIGPNELHFVDHKFCLAHHRRADLYKCDNYYGILSELLGGLASPVDHSKRASALRPLFSGDSLAAYSTEMDSYLEHLRQQLAGIASQEHAVNLTHYIWAYTNDIMISYITGEDSGFLKSPDLQAVHDKTRAFSAIDLATLLRCMPPVKLMFDLLPSLRRISPLAWTDKLVGTYLEPMTKSWHHEKGHNTVLSHLWAGLGKETLVTHESSQAIFIRNESLLSNLTFLLHYLIQDPSCVSKLRAELDTLDIATYGNQVWRDPNILRLPYLGAVCKEATRLSSPGWHRQPRQIPEPVHYRGTIIPPMTSLSFTLRLLELDPILFPEPLVFKPERFMGSGDEAKEARNNAVGFGTGSRTCLGQHIGRVVLRKTIACLVYNFDISLWDEGKDKEEGYRYLDTYPKKGHEGYMRTRVAPRF